MTNDKGHLLTSTDAYSGLGYEKQSVSFLYTSTGLGAADNFNHKVVGAGSDPEVNGYRLYRVFLKVDPAAGMAFAADKLDFKVVDIDGVVSPPGTVLATMVDNRFLWAGLEHEYGADPHDLIPHGTYLRARYISALASTPTSFTVEIVRRKV